MKEDTELIIEPNLSEEEDKYIDKAAYKINTYGVDYTLELLAKKIEQGEVKIPTFQRKYVWPEKKASKLIESFLLGLPVPQIFLFRKEISQDLLVVDGQQRLLTVKYFFEGKYDTGQTFRLRSVRQDWEGKTFDDLSESDKRKLKNNILRTTIFEQLDPQDESSVFEIFERLNTGGVALNQQEIRNCVVNGNINKWLADLNSNTQWRALLSQPTPDKRMKDVEMILRFFALYSGWGDYKKPMKDFITTFMRENKDINIFQQQQYRELFNRVISKVYEDLGEKAFKIKAGINIALFDSLCVAVANMPETSTNSLKMPYEELLNDQSYKAAISQSTTDTDNVQTRIKLAMRYFSAK